ncbi:MAG: hypothetical protein AB7O62_18410 [Pirellulales bacterium]
MLNSKRPDKKHVGGAPLLVVLVLLLPVLYVASTGPACWLEVNGFISNEMLGLVYAPLIWMMKHSEPIHTAIERYCQMWVP